jgi:citrate/tricarballylate utilization protein
MTATDLAAEGARVMTVCNACRYCEQYCPVFPAMERRLTFSRADLDYLANLCHNCGECLYACQYAPPHEFGINVPRTLADVRVASYEAYCWPAALASAFQRQGAAVALALAAGFTAALIAALAAFNPGAAQRAGTSAAFYEVVPHAVMVALFGGVALFALAAIAIGVRRFWREIARASVEVTSVAAARALRDALSLAHLHPQGADCTQAEETRRPWRRWLHHATFYGFGLCTLSTSVAAVYHGVFGWEAPYPYTSVPVVLGSLGGVGLIVGPAGLLLLRRGRDPMLSNAPQSGLDVSFLTLLLATSVTGLALLALRQSTDMPALLAVHLGCVLALFVTLPYGKFVHGLYRTAALVVSAAETAADGR